MNAHTHTAAAVLPRGALAGERPLLSPGTHSSALPRQSDPGVANSPAASVAGAFPHNAKPVTYNGITYPSQIAMSRALGIPARTISDAVKRNALHSMGKLNPLEVATAARRQPVAAHGWEWSSQTEAAKALGIGDSAVCDMLRRGTFARNVLKRLGVKP